MPVSLLQKALWIAGLAVAIGLILAFSYHDRQAARERRAAIAAERDQRQRVAAELQARESTRLAEEAVRAQYEEQRILYEKREKLQDMLSAALADPYSIRLQNVSLSRGAGGAALCGEVNAKDASGKFFGLHRFAVTETKMEGAEGNVVGIPKAGKSSDDVPALLAAAGCM